jgi:dihydroorotase
LGLNDRGLIAPGQRADLVIAAPEAPWTVNPALFRSRGKNTPFAGMTLRGKVIATYHAGHKRVMDDG